MKTLTVCVYTAAIMACVTIVVSVLLDNPGFAIGTLLVFIVGMLAVLLWVEGMDD